MSQQVWSWVVLWHHCGLSRRHDYDIAEVAYFGEAVMSISNTCDFG